MGIHFFSILTQQVKLVIIHHNDERDYVTSPKVYGKEENKPRLVSFRTKCKFPVFF